MPTRIKICGVREPGTAEAASEAGADALGLVLYAGSPRAVTPQQAAVVARATAPLVTLVGLFVDPSVDEVEAALSLCDFDCLQFHGNEPAEFCTQFCRPYIKAVSMRPGVDVRAEVEKHAQARAVLLDTWRAGVPGGTGHTFDWSIIPTIHSPWILAGGLNAGNVGAAIDQVSPPAVDVSGGVEDAPGEKSTRMIRQFVAAVRSADGSGDGSDERCRAEQSRRLAC